MTANFDMSLEIQNKLKLDTATSFFCVRDWSSVPKKKFDRVLYYLQEEDNEESVLNNLLNLCNPKGMVLISNVPEVNKRLSNGTLKYNKEVFPEVVNNHGISNFWFLESRKDHCFEFLMELGDYK